MVSIIPLKISGVAVSRLVACMALLAFHGPSFAAPDLPRTAAPASATAVATSVLMPRGERAVVGRKPGGFLCKSTMEVLMGKLSINGPFCN